MTPRWRFVLTFAVVAIVAVGYWTYIFFIADPLPPDKLDDPAFAKQAQTVCASTFQRLTDAGVVDQRASTPQARADLVDRADKELRDMVAQLRAIPISNDNDRDALSKWLADWDQWLKDRADFAAELHAGNDTQFFEKQDANGSPNSQALNAFAITNEMPACATPAGV